MIRFYFRFIQYRIHLRSQWWPSDCFTFARKICKFQLTKMSARVLLLHLNKSLCGYMLKTFKNSSQKAILMLINKTSFGHSIKIFLVYFKNYGKGLVLSLWPLLHWSSGKNQNGERSGSVVECLTRDWGVAGSSLTGVTALWSLSKTHLS